MTVSPPIATSVLPERRTGRLPVQDKEERRAIGRFVHKVEEHGMGTAAHLARATELTGEHFPIADAGCDAAVDRLEVGNEQAVEILETLLRYGLLDDYARRQVGRALAPLRENHRHVAEYRRQDVAEDGTIRQAHYEERAAQTENHGTLALCEQTLTGAGRNRPRPRPVDAAQLALDGEGGGCL